MDAARNRPGRRRTRPRTRSALARWRSGLIRTTFHTRPSFSSAADHEPGRIGQALPGLQAVEGGGREGMVVVVPGLAHRQRREPEHVARLVLDREPLAPEEVADRVDRPGHVVEQEHPDEAAPQERGERAAEAAADDPPERERDREGQRDPQGKQLVDHAQGVVLHQVGRESLTIGRADGLEQPPHVRMPQALHAAPEARAAQVGGVWIAVLVGERVVLAVVGHPPDHRTLDRHRAEHGDDRPERRRGLERAVREHAVVAERDAQAGDT